MRLPSLRETLVLALSATLTLGTLPISAAGKPKSAPTSAAAPVDHAALLVNRFTFGPKPGEIDQVRALGPEKWFEQQLTPDRIPDAALDARLAQYPAMQMSQEERIERYPTPNQIRQFAKSGALPQDPTLRTIVADQVEFYQERQKERQKAKPAAASNAGTAALENQQATSNGIAANQPGSPTPANVRRGQAALFASSDPQGGSDMASHAVEPWIRADGKDTRPNTASNAAPIVRLAPGGARMTVPPAANETSPPNFEQTIQPMPQPQVDALLATPPDQRYQQVMRLPIDQLIALRKGLRGRDGKLAEGMTPLEKETLVSLAGTNRMISTELFGTRLLTDIYSNHELEAVMTDFWLNHFNVYIKKDGQMPSLLPQFQQTIQQHALGKFEDLLLATAQSPAMLLYLDNAQSIGPDSPATSNGPRGGKKKAVGLNENYARELMELHTLGVNGGYTQNDVTEVANVLTGWTTDKPTDGGQFTFNDRRHEPGDKTVLGQTIHDGGQKEGEQVLHLLATSPATAHFISLELAERFVADTPPPVMVHRMAATFLKSNGDMKAVLRTMVHSPEFFTAATVHAKLKTPLEYVVSAVRATGADVQNPQPLAQSLERLGMPLYGCQPPTGYKWDSETWLSSSALVNRMNFSLLLSSNRVAGTTVALPTLLADGKPAATVESDPAQKEQALETTLLEVPANAQTRIAVLSQSDDAAVQQAAHDFQVAPGNASGKQAGGKQIVQVRGNAFGQPTPKPGPAPADKQGSVMLGLLLGSPEFQRR